MMEEGTSFRSYSEMEDAAGNVDYVNSGAAEFHEHDQASVFVQGGDSEEVVVEGDDGVGRQEEDLVLTPARMWRPRTPASVQKRGSTQPYASAAMNTGGGRGAPVRKGERACVMAEVRPMRPALCGEGSSGSVKERVLMLEQRMLGVD
jgi:hypothetical protein